MRLATLFGPDFHATLAEDPNAFREALAEFHEEDIAEIVTDLPLEDVVALLRVLPNDFSAGVLERLTDEARTQILEKLKVEEAATLLAEMARTATAASVPTSPPDAPSRESGSAMRGTLPRTLL